MVTAGRAVRASRAAAAVGVALAGALAGATPARAVATLNSGTGPGSVTVTVTNSGAFGSGYGIYDASDAVYDRVGGAGQGGTTYGSTVYLGFLDGGTRINLGQRQAELLGSGPNAAQSRFSEGSLGFVLLQELGALVIDGARAGSVLTQTYTITNAGAEGVDFELVRFLDGDLNFNGGAGREDDGGGRYLAADGTEILFETDTAVGTSQSDTFVGIANEGGTSTGFDVLDYSTLGGNLDQGRALEGRVAGDGPDADQFIDQGNGYDTSLALGRAFTLAAGQSATFTTRTFFGTAAAAAVQQPPSGAVPEPATWATMLVGLGAAGAAMRRRQRTAVRFA